MKRLFFIVLSAVLTTTGMRAQDDNSIQGSYNQYRQNMLSSYQNYRQSIFDEYYKYLDGIWKEYEAVRGAKRDETPKPKILPDIKNKPATEPVKLKEPKVKPLPKPARRPAIPRPFGGKFPDVAGNRTKPGKPTPVPNVPATPVPVRVPDVSVPVPDVPVATPVPVPDVPDFKPVTPLDSPVSEPEPEPKDEPKQEEPAKLPTPTLTTPVIPRPTVVPILPVPAIAPTPTITPIKPEEMLTLPAGDRVDFDFYGIQISLPKAPVIHCTSEETSAIAATWKSYLDNGAQEVVDPIIGTAAYYSLNDWFTFELVRKYTNTLQAGGSSTDRIVLQHFLLTALGYDIRLAKTKVQYILLVPFQQMFYDHAYLRLDDVKYFVFYDELKRIDESSMTLYTCDLPKNADKGEPVDLAIRKGMNVTSGKTVSKTLNDGVMNVEAEVDVTLMEMLRHYPQTEIPYYAASTVVSDVHKALLEQLRPQIAGLSQLEAVNKLSKFIQKVFDYATDDAQHGYEKPYFIEENFFYPKNDCEDRSILLVFLVRGLLGLDTHLVQFPGHECTGIHFTEPIDEASMDTYNYKNKTYVITDPTYIGSDVGMCMPEFKGVQPEIQLW